MRHSVLSDEAVADIARIDRFLTLVAPASAPQAAGVILAGIDGICACPEAGSAVAVGLRQRAVRFGRGSYVIRYRVDPDRIVIARIWHSCEDRPDRPDPTGP